MFLGKTLYSHGASLHPGVKMGTGEFSAGGNPAMDEHPIQGGVEILSVASCYRNVRNRDKLQPDGPLGPNADFTLPYLTICQLMTSEKFLLCIAFSSNKFRDSQALIKLWAEIHLSLGSVVKGGLHVKTDFLLC